MDFLIVIEVLMINNLGLSVPLGQRVIEISEAKLRSYPTDLGWDRGQIELGITPR